MASIVQRKTKYAVVYWYLDDDGIRKQKWDTFETKKEAKIRKSFIEYFQQTEGLVLVPIKEQYSAEYVAAYEKIEVPNTDIRLEEFLKIFVDIYGVSKWSASTYSNKVSTINNYINPFIGDWKLNEITTKKLSNFYNQLLGVPQVAKANGKMSGECVQPPSIKKVHDIIRCALNQAILWEYLDTKMRNPASMATLPKISKNRRKVWDVETFKVALSLTDDTILLIAMHLAFACSLRIGEIAGLTWDDVFIEEADIKSGNARVIINKELSRVDFEVMQKLKGKDIIQIFPTLKAYASTRLVLKTPKTETSNRTVWLPETVAILLQKHKRDQQEVKSFLGTAYHDYNLVLALDNGAPVESRIVQERFRLLWKNNNLEEVVFHSLRHLSTGYKLKMTNGDVKSVQGDTGHAEAEMVMDVYSRIIDEDRRNNAKKLNTEFYDALRIENKEKNTLSDESKPNLLEVIQSMSSEEQEKLLQELVMKLPNK